MPLDTDFASSISVGGRLRTVVVPMNAASAAFLLSGLLSGCQGHFNVRKDELEQPSIDCAENHQRFNWWRVEAHRRFLAETEVKLRAWNTSVAVISGILAVGSASGGAYALTKSDEGAKLAGNVTSIVSGVLAAVGAGVVIWSFTGDHGHVRSRVDQLAEVLSESPSTAYAAARSIRDDKTLPPVPSTEQIETERLLRAHFGAQSDLSHCRALEDVCCQDLNLEACKRAWDALRARCDARPDLNPRQSSQCNRDRLSLTGIIEKLTLMASTCPRGFHWGMRLGADGAAASDGQLRTCNELGFQVAQACGSYTGTPPLLVPPFPGVLVDPIRNGTSTIPR